MRAMRGGGAKLRESDSGDEILNPNRNPLRVKFD